MNTAEEKRTPMLPVLRFEFGSELIVEDITEHPIAIVAHAEGRSVADKREIAAQIVLACNSFDALTEANKKLVAALEYYAATPSSYGQVARAVLKAAKVTP